MLFINLNPFQNAPRHCFPLSMECTLRQCITSRSSEHLATLSTRDTAAPNCCMPGMPTSPPPLLLSSSRMNSDSFDGTINPTSIVRGIQEPVCMSQPLAAHSTVGRFLPPSQVPQIIVAHAHHKRRIDQLNSEVGTRA